MKHSGMEQTDARSRGPLRIKIALALALAALLLSQLLVILSLVRRLPSAIETEGMARYEKRYAEVRKVLPRSGLIGYVSEPPDGKQVTQGLYDRRYHAAEYHLAPLVIADSLAPDLILGNFFSPAVMEKVVTEHKLAVLRDFRNGVFILRKGGS